MKTLDEHNQEARERHRLYESLTGGLPCKNGIACPRCGKEMFDTSPNVTLTSNPPQLNVHCEDCGYTGYRVS